MQILGKRLPAYVDRKGVIGRKDDGSFILRIDEVSLRRMIREGWTASAEGAYAVVTCPPPPLPDIPNHKLQELLADQRNAN